MYRVLIVLVLSLIPVDAIALKKLDGYFIAIDACEGFQSKNKGTNPGGVVTDPMRAYSLKGINKVGGDFYQIEMPGAPVTNLRWVSVSCGVHVVEAGTRPDSGDASAPIKPTPTVGSVESTDNLLALTWQPAFCETKPNKTECQHLNDGRLPITERQLSIHGLWPQPRGNAYCNVPPDIKKVDKDRRWSALPPVEMDNETRALLDVAMPGSASFLDRHEWIKHGTCYFDQGGSDAYYDDTLWLTEQVNHVLGDFLTQHVGAEVKSADIRGLFDTAFGPGAGDRVHVQCKSDQDRVLIQELRIALKGEISSTASFGNLLLAADSLAPGCTTGIVDPTGLQ